MSVDKVDKRLLGPVLAGFFIMGFCDMVAPITGRIAAEFPPGQQAAVSFLPTMVFLWFLVLSTPVAALMNRWGRKATALLGYGFTVAGLMTPYAAGADCALGWYFAGFGLLGVGNTAIQVAVNPLLVTIVPGERMTATSPWVRSSATLRSCCWLRSSRGWSPRRVRGGSCCRSMRALRWSGVSGCN